MVESTNPVALSSRCSLPRGIDDLAMRVRAEFHEMPGLKLTLPQAARFFGVEPARCQQVLETLVHAGQLVTDGRTFARRESWGRSIRN